MKRVLFVALMAIVAVQPVRAASLKVATVDAAARWVLHIDMEGVLQSQMGKLVVADATNRQFVAGMEFVKNNLGLDPLKDVTGATFYGTRYGGKDVVGIIRGNLNPDRITGFLKLNESYEEVSLDGVTFHKWVDKNNGRPAVVSFAAGAAVVGQDQDRVRNALDVLAGKVDGLKVSGPLHGLQETSSSLIVVSAVRDDQELGGKLNASLLRNAQWLALSAGEADGKIRVDLQAGADSPEIAAQMEQLARGTLAFMALSREQNPALAEFAQSISITRAGEVVKATLSYSVDAAYEWLKKQSRRPAAAKTVPETPVDIPSKQP